MRLFVETMPDCVGVYEAVRDAGGEIVDFAVAYANEMACLNLATPREGMIGQRLGALPALPLGGSVERYREVVERGEALYADAVEHGGRWYDVRVSKFGDGVVASWRDVTQRRQTEHELQRSNAELRASHEVARARAEELAVLMDALPAAVWIAHDAACGHISGSRAAHEILRMPEGANLSKTPVDAAPPSHFRVLRHGVELSPAELPVQRAARGEEVRDFEEEIVFDTGERVFLYGNAMPLRARDGTLRGAISAFVDVTARRRAAEERDALLASERQARAEAEAASQAKDHFLATVSHELRTPLTAVIGYLQMLRAGAVPDDRAASILETIERNARLQMHLINDILDMSGIIAGKLTLELQPVSIAGVLGDALATIRPSAAAKGVDLVHDGPADAATVYADPRRLHQVVLNVLTNAVKFTPSGGVVRATHQVIGNQVEIAISDTGLGIAPADLPRVFERFWQEDTTSPQRPGGLGLGLAIAHHIVAAHGGSIEASSAGVGHGATFHIRIPIGTTGWV